MGSVENEMACTMHNEMGTLLIQWLTSGLHGM